MGAFTIPNSSMFSVLFPYTFSLNLGNGCIFHTQPRPIIWFGLGCSKNEAILGQSMFSVLFPYTFSINVGNGCIYHTQPRPIIWSGLACSKKQQILDQSMFPVLFPYTFSMNVGNGCIFHTQPRPIIWSGLGSSKNEAILGQSMFSVLLSMFSVLFPYTFSLNLGNGCIFHTQPRPIIWFGLGCSKKEAILGQSMFSVLFPYTILNSRRAGYHIRILSWSNLGPKSKKNEIFFEKKKKISNPKPAPTVFSPPNFARKKFP
jgi:hypothetical protein